MAAAPWTRPDHRQRREHLANALQQLHHASQSIWLDNIRKDLLTAGTLARHLNEYAVSGVISNPTILEKAISGGADYDTASRHHVTSGVHHAEDLVFALALEDLVAAADLLRPVYEVTRGTDRYVSVEVSPELAHDTEGTVSAGRLTLGSVGGPQWWCPWCYLSKDWEVIRGGRGERRCRGDRDGTGR